MGHADNRTDDKAATIPTVRVSLVHLLPHQCKMVPIQVDPGLDPRDFLLLEPATQENGAQVDAAVVRPTEGGTAEVIYMLSNHTYFPCYMEQGTTLGEASEATLVQQGELPVEGSTVGEDPLVQCIHAEVEAAAQRQKLVGKPELLNAAQRQELRDLLEEHHTAFCLEEQERGEMDFGEMRILTGDAEPRKVPASRMPFAVHSEVARQLRCMQESGVIQPSCSPWASPVVMVRKKDGTHRFCVNYRELNSVTKADTFLLLCIDDLLDQLGKSRYLSTLDLVSGYWQIRIDRDSREKTAFVMPHGLFEFKVMPFGLTNAPAV